MLVQIPEHEGNTLHTYGCFVPEAAGNNFLANLIWQVEVGIREVVPILSVISMLAILQVTIEDFSELRIVHVAPQQTI